MSDDAKTDVTAEAVTPKPTRTDRKLLADYLAAIDEGRRLYAEADAYAAKMLDRMPIGTVLKATDGRTVTLVDNFAHDNVAFKPCGVKRFDVKVKAAPKSKAKKPPKGKSAKS